MIANFLLSDLPFEDMVVTVQLEIAERLIAQPSTKDYGVLAVLVQSLADITVIRRLPPTVFFPRPQVSSAIIQVRPDADKRAKVGDVLRLRHFLPRSVQPPPQEPPRAPSAMPSRQSKGDVDRQLAELAIDGTVRAEALDREQHLRLCAVFG